MRTVTASVKRIIEKDPVAFEALGRGHLNTHAYARSIQLQVEEWCFKDVKTNTIVTSLLRLRSQIAQDATLVPNFSMNAITVKMNLAELALVKGDSSKEVSKWLTKQTGTKDDFFLAVSGNRETNLIFPARLLPDVRKKFSFGADLNGVVEHLAAVTLSYESKLTFEPNVGYALMRALALKHINVVEVISSYSEVTFLVSEDDVDVTIDTLKQFLK